MVRSFLIASLAALMAASAHAADCAPTPQVPVVNYPGASHIPRGNNLLLPAGKAVAAQGQRVVIVGHVYDRHCVPLIGAAVEMWQANPFGRWLLATSEDQVSANAVFAGAGRTYTDNNGQFTFTTVFPAAIGTRAPSVNVRIYAERMPVFSTQLFFGMDQRNGRDPSYRKIGAPHAITLNMGQFPDGSLMGGIDLVLPQTSTYRRY